MAVAPYTLRLFPPPPRDAPRRLFPPPPRDAPLLPRLRPHLLLRAAAGWAPAGSNADEVGGWWLPEQPLEQEGRKTGVGRAIAVGLGATAAIAWAGLGWYFPSSRKSLQKFSVTPLHYVQEKFSTLQSPETPAEDKEADESEVSSTALDEKAESITGDSMQSQRKASSSYISFRVPVDPAHEEAFSILQKLQIIEEDVSASDFCTRKEFARWFIKLCSKFERNRRQRIVPNKLICGTVQSAFDDVNIDDPDFLYIQSLGESGIVRSNLSNSMGTLPSVSPSCEGNSKFLPDSCLSRFDLISWKLLVEHPSVLEIDQKMLSQNVPILDLNACPEVPASMLVEMMAGENNIISRVFGNTRRLQPYKRVTKAQVAAALTSGRMEEAIRDELNRLEAENQARLSAIAEIMEELIARGDIPRYWEEKMKEEQEHALEVDRDLQHAMNELEDERADREKEVPDLLKERAALERQNEELISLRSEVDEMYERLEAESAAVMASQQTLDNLSADMSSKQQAVNETKSCLEAEKEALTMLRSWVEEEAARVHERAETLEKAVRRWRIPVE